MGMERKGPWKQVRRMLASAPAKLRAAIDRATMQEAQFLRTKIVEGLREQAPGGKAFAPLAETTLAVRRFRGFRGTKALIVQGDLRNSITAVKEGGRVFVGVLRTARGRAGQPLANIAALNEYGSAPIVVRLTSKSRAFLHAAFRAAGLAQAAAGTSIGIAVIHIRPRPFIAPVFERYGADRDAVARRFLDRVAKALG